MSIDVETELKMTREHYAKYEAFAQALGIGCLKCIVDAIVRLHGYPVDLAEEWVKDRHLNNIRLSIWDAYAPQVHRLYSDAKRAGKCNESGGWSLANSVCVLKHVASYYVAGATLDETLRRAEIERKEFNSKYGR